MILFRQPPDACRLFVTNIPLRPSWDELRLKLIASCENTLLVHSVRMHTETRTELVDEYVEDQADPTAFPTQTQQSMPVDTQPSAQAQAPTWSPDLEAGAAPRIAPNYNIKVSHAANANLNSNSLHQNQQLQQPSIAASNPINSNASAGAEHVVGPIDATQSVPIQRSTCRPRCRTETHQFKWATIAYYCVEDATTAKQRLNNLRTAPKQSRKRSRNAPLQQDDLLSTQMPMQTQASTQVNASGGVAHSRSGNDESRSSRLRVRFFRRLRPIHSPPSHSCLAYADCINLCNYLLGFNAWSCCIDEIRPFSVEKGDEEIEQQDVFVQQLAAPAPKPANKATNSLASANNTTEDDQSSTQVSDPDSGTTDIESTSTQVASRSPSAYSRQIDAARQAAKANNYQGSYTATVSLHVRHAGGSQLTATACAHSDALTLRNRFAGAQRGDASSTAHASCKKRAVTNAYRVLFHNLAIVRLADGKCAVLRI